MGVLMHIAEKVQAGESVTGAWALLRNVYFRGPDPVTDMRKWAAENGIEVSFDYDEETPFRYGGKVRSVNFYPKPKSR